MTCRCGLAVRFCPDLNAYGHIDRLPRGRGHYVRLSPTPRPADDFPRSSAERAVGGDNLVPQARPRALTY